MSNNKPVLLILAAGVGSRYGGLKQLDGIGPQGETIMDYSIFDAIRSGFGKVVFVIKDEHLDLFETQITSKFKSEIEVGYVFQRIDRLPDGIAVPLKRTKPWGTGHAILCARQEISRPFAVINADDFYGVGAFQTMVNTLEKTDSQTNEFYLVGYRLANTVSEHGSVSRGLCGSLNGYLTGIKELTKVSVANGRISYRDNNMDKPLKPDDIVSMNFWGFTPKMFDYIETGFERFIRENLDSPDAEYFITRPVDDAIRSNQVQVKVLTTEEKWMGITYLADKEAVINGIRSRIDAGHYPEDLSDEWQ